MPPTVLAGVGASFLLVLPALVAACAMLTAPVARWIGRRHGEERQVLRAPLIVGCIGLTIEGLVAALLAGTLPPGTASTLVFLDNALQVDRYALTTVCAISAVGLAALVSAELARPDDRPLGPSDVGPVLVLCAVVSATALMGTLKGVGAGLFLAAGAAGLVLVLGSREATQVHRGILAVVAAGLPLVAWFLLAPYRTVGLDVELSEAVTVFHMREPAYAYSTLRRLWLSGMAVPLAAIACMAAVTRERPLASPGLAALAGLTVAGLLPTVFRVSAEGFPDDSWRAVHDWLADRLGLYGLLVGLITLAVVQAPLSAFRRLCLLSVGSVCVVMAALRVHDVTASGSVLIQMAVAGVLIPVCFAVVSAGDAVRAPRLRGPAWWPRIYSGGLPLLAAIPWGWSSVLLRPPIGYRILMSVLSLSLLAAGIRLSVQLVRGRPGETLGEGRFIRVRRWGAAKRAVTEVLVTLLVVAIAAALAASWLRQIPPWQEYLTLACHGSLLAEIAV